MARKYNVTVTEIFTAEVTVQAKSAADAERLVEEMCEDHAIDEWDCERIVSPAEEIKR